MDFFSFLAGNLQFRHDFFYSSISNESMNEWSNECGKTKTKIYKKNRNKNLIINWTENFIEFFRFGEKKMIFANPDFVVRFLFPLIMVKGCVFRRRQNKNRNKKLKFPFKEKLLSERKKLLKKKKRKKIPNCPTTTKIDRSIPLSIAIESTEKRNNERIRFSARQTKNKIIKFWLPSMCD